MGRPVRNVPGTSFRSPKPLCGCPNWLTHVEIETETEDHACANIDCGNIAQVGAHVWHLTGDSKQYLIPLCRPCNKIPSDVVFHIDGRLKLVYANVRHGGARPMRRSRTPAPGLSLGEGLAIVGAVGVAAVGVGLLIKHLTTPIAVPPPQPPPPSPPPSTM